MTGYSSKQKRSTLEAIINCLSICSQCSGKDKNSLGKDLGQVDCKKCYYACKEDNTIEVRCKQCENSQGESGVCSKCKRQKLLCADKGCKKCYGKDVSNKDDLCKNKRTINGQEDKSTVTDIQPPGPEYKEINPNMLAKLDCKVCGFEKQDDGTKDFVCSPCIDKARMNLSSPEQKRIEKQDLTSCEQCGVEIKKGKRQNMLRVICERCEEDIRNSAQLAAFSGKRPQLNGPLVVSNITPYSVELKWPKPEEEPDRYLIQLQENPPKGDWRTVQTLPGNLDPTSTIISDLTPGGFFAYRVIAEKNNRQSEPIMSEFSGQQGNDVPTPGGPLKVIGTSTTSFVLNWKHPKQGAMPKSYLVEKQQHPNGPWEKVREIQCDPTRPPSAVVDDLEPDASYNFRVTSKIDDRSSPPLQSDKPVSPSRFPYSDEKSCK
ncbi:tenascin-N-like isoform X4 [Rhodnius prolixus]|uniref:tenascin-N-like isoform X4 n=1 Tax=Rhodnius prolixus TaxID=13249 RepID=UPI003D1883B9